jgi:hypothetical protein
MTHFQLGLVCIGILVWLMVLLHGIWVSRSSIPKQARSPRTARANAADGTPEPQEPSFSDNGLFPSETPRPVALRKPGMDPLIDVIASLTLEASAPAVLGDVAIAALPPTRRVGSKPFAIEGYNLAPEAWEPVQAGQRYSAFQAGVQLANRSGPLNEIEYSEFVVKAQAFADAINAQAEFVDMREAVARARELDQFASAHDAQIGLSLRARNASWSPGYVQQHAADLGFVAGLSAGRMVFPASQPGLPPVVVLSFDPHAALAEDPALSAIRTLDLHLDVAQVARAEQGFERICNVAYALAQAMDGIVTDDHGQTLAPEGLDQINTQLQTLYNRLEQRDLAAGSPLARRLFS